MEEYAFYEGDDIVAIGTLDEISKSTGESIDRLKYYFTGRYKRRCKNNRNSKEVIILEEDDEEERTKLSQYSKEERERWLKVANDNNINYNTFVWRISRGMSIKTAATKDIEKGFEKRAKEECKKNGIKFETFKSRFYKLGWDYEKAISTPVKKRIL